MSAGVSVGNRKHIEKIHIYALWNAWKQNFNNFHTFTEWYSKDTKFPQFLLKFLYHIHSDCQSYKNYFTKKNVKSSPMHHNDHIHPLEPAKHGDIVVCGCQYACAIEQKPEAYFSDWTLIWKIWLIGKSVNDLLNSWWADE